MTRVTYTTWARLEPRVSDPTLEPGIRAAIEDPLWLLGRQWQLGELDGEDAGSPIGVDVFGTSVALDRLLVGGPAADNRSRAVDLDAAAAPLESLVAREPAPDPEGLLAFRLDLAGRVARELVARGGSRDALDGLRAAHPLDPAEVEAARAGCGPAEAARIALLAARLFDGAALLLAAEDDLATATSGMSAPAAAAVRAVLDAVRTEVDLPAGRAAGRDAATPDAWRPESLGSSFALGAAAAGGEVVLRADDWGGEELDWWSLDRSGEAALGARWDAGAPHRAERRAALAAAVPPGVPRRAQRAVLEAFEDGAADLVSVTAGAHETALMAVLQFAFLYSGDWSSVPIEVAVGSLVSVASVVVRDTFGARTLVMPTGRDAARPAQEQTRLWTATGDAGGSLACSPGWARSWRARRSRR